MQEHGMAGHTKTEVSLSATSFFQALQTLPPHGLEIKKKKRKKRLITIKSTRKQLCKL